MLDIEILTPEGITFSGQGNEVLIPTTQGVIGVRTGHLPLIAPIRPGEIVIKQEGGKEERLAVAGGFAEVLSNQVHILADAAESSDALDEELVAQAVEHARQAKESATNQVETDKATALIEANLAKLKIAQRKKARGERHYR